MALPSLSWLAKVGEAAARAIPGMGTGLGFIALIYDLGDKMVAGGLNWLLSMVNSIDTSAFSNASFALVTGIGYGNAVFALDEAITVWTALAVACGAVAVIRWVKSVIPTVSN